MESYKQIKADLDVLRQSVEKSELWVYKSKATEEHGNKKKKSKEEEEEGTTSRKTPLLSLSDKQGVYYLIVLFIFFISYTCLFIYLSF